MLPTIHRDNVAGDPASPFMPGEGTGLRPLRLTLNFTQPDALSAAEQFALGLIRDLLPRPSIEVADTAPTSLTKLRVKIQPDGDCVALSDSEHGTRGTAAGKYDHYEQWVRRHVPGDQFNDALRDALIAGAHAARRADLLITDSAFLLTLPPSDREGACTTVEACKVIGLLLRHRNDYRICGGGVQFFVGPFLFYNQLRRARLPHASALFRHGVQLRTAGGDPRPQALANAILRRAEWALQARDAIGVQFHQPGSHVTLATELYHFNYLTLLLAGMLDAEARMLVRLYGITGRQHRRPSLWHPAFQEVLQTAGGGGVAATLSDPAFRHFGTLLKTLRNTIHDELPEPRLSVRPDQPMGLRIAQADGLTIVEAARAEGGCAAWGLTEHQGVVEYEPYAYAVRLVDTTFAWVDRIAAATGLTVPAAAAVFTEPLCPDLSRRVLALG